MTKPITINLTLDELKTLDKFVELNDETRPLFDKIRNAYPKPETLLDVIRNLGYSYDMCYEIVDAVEEFQKPKEPEDNEWKTVALGFGENLSAIGPDGYYDFTPVEWYDWVVDIYENTANEYLKLQEPEQVNTFAPKELEELIRESKKWCEEHPNESVEEYLKPHTPEKTEKLLREAFQKAQQTEEWKETQRKIDAPKESWMNKPVEELVAMLEKNPPDCLKFVMGKSLEGLIEEWWIDVFVGPNEKWTMEECIADLCDRIFLWLPKEQSAAGSQSLGVEDLVDGFNDAIKKIKSKIHNKKVTP